MKRARYHWLSAMALACIASYAPAHGDMEKIQDALSAPNGGRLRLSGQYYIELVAQPRQLTVHAMHADTKAPIDLAQASGAAIVLLDGKKEIVDLAPTGTQLTGEGQFASAENATIAVLVKLADGTQLSGKFSPRNDRH